MIREFSVKAKPSNNNARLAFSVSCALGLGLVLLSLVIPLYRGIVSLVGMLLLVVAITLYTKYVSPVFYYDVTFDSEGTPLFVVRQLIGKRETTLCRIGLNEMVKIERESSKERGAHKTPYGFRTYAYLPTLMPEVCYRITSMSRYEKSEILIEVSEEYASLLRSYSAEARELAKINDDEY